MYVALIFICILRFVFGVVELAAMECFTVRDGLSRENARFHEASYIMYLDFDCAFKTAITATMVKSDINQHYLQNVLGKEDSRMDQRT